MGLTPHIIEEEHAIFHRRVTELIDSESNCWKYFIELMKTMEKHEKLEEMVLVPLLNYVESRILEKKHTDTAPLIGYYRKLLENYDILISEHQSMIKILKDIKGETYLVEISELIDSILHHIRMEEEMAYPAAIAAGELLNIERNSSGETRTGYESNRLLF